MQRSWISIAVALSLTLTAGAACAATAGHLFKSTTTQPPNSEDMTGSTKPTGTARGGASGSISKPQPRIMSRPATVPAQ